MSATRPTPIWSSTPSSWPSSADDPTKSPFTIRTAGGIYTSLAFGKRATELGITRSFGSTGDCYDNSAVEAVWATLKRELHWIYGRKTWPTRDLLRSVLFDYIEGFYNSQRTQKRLGYRSPAEFESAAVA